MKILIAVVAGALMGVSAVAGKPDSAEAFQPESGSSAADVVAIGPVVDALRSGDVTYASYSMLSLAERADYVPMKPPL